MSISAYDLRQLVQIAVPFAAALLAVSASHAPSQAQAEASHVLVIPASDGYGFDDCLSANKACGHVIADAWCEAHGMSAAVTFGRAEDVTASIADRKPAAKIESGGYIVNCKG